MPPNRASVINLEQLLRADKLASRQNESLLATITAARGAGETPAKHLGRGLDFEELQAYQLGDDVRDIDWKVTARMQSPYVRRHVQQSFQRRHIIVDADGSAFFATKGLLKLTQAAVLAQFFARDAINQQSAVTLHIVGESLYSVDCGRSAEAVISVLLTLNQMSSTETPPLTKTLLPLSVLGQAEQECLLLSNLARLTPSPLWMRLALKYQCYVSLLIDDLEQNLPHWGRFVLRGEGLERDINSNAAATRQHWQAQYEAKSGECMAQFEQLGVPIMRFSTDEDVTACLMQQIRF